MIRVIVDAISRKPPRIGRNLTPCRRLGIKQWLLRRGELFFGGLFWSWIILSFLWISFEWINLVFNQFVDYSRWMNWAQTTFLKTKTWNKNFEIWKFGNFDPGPSRWRNTCCRWTEERSLRSGRTSLCWQAVFTFSIFMKKLYSLSRLSVSNSRISKEVGLVDQHRKEWGRVDYFAVN